MSPERSAPHSWTPHLRSGRRREDFTFRGPARRQDLLRGRPEDDEGGSRGLGEKQDAPGAPRRRRRVETEERPRAPKTMPDGPHLQRLRQRRSPTSATPGEEGLEQERGTGHPKTMPSGPPLQRLLRRRRNEEAAPPSRPPPPRKPRSRGRTQTDDASRCFLQMDSRSTI